MKPQTIPAYHAVQAPQDQAIMETLCQLITAGYPDAQSKMYYAHPVWFLNENPIVSYGKLKNCVRLMFWSGQSFGDVGLKKTGSFKAAEHRFKDVAKIDATKLAGWLELGRGIQWDYKNVARNKGRLDRIC